MDVTHTGTLIAPDGDRHPAFFYIGREDEVISAVQTRNAATAIANVDPACRHLVMVGFGRDGDAHSVGRYRPGMTILQVQMNRDLQLPWLKEEKTDSAFTIISEPEVLFHQLDDGRVQLEVVGLNCFNPKLGVVEVGDARQMMGIMVDTEYDTESFRARLINVRQVGRNQRTLRNLRAAFNREIDPEKWEQMLTTKTVPFELPEPGSKDRSEGNRPDGDGTHDGDRRPEKSSPRGKWVATDGRGSSDSPQGVEDPRIIEIPTTSQRQFCLPSTSARRCLRRGAAVKMVFGAIPPISAGIWVVSCNGGNGRASRPVNRKLLRI